MEVGRDYDIYSFTIGARRIIRAPYLCIKEKREQMVPYKINHLTSHRRLEEVATHVTRSPAKE